MIELSNTTAQTVPVGQAITFDTVIWKTGCKETFRRLSSVVNFVGNQCGCNSIFQVEFSGNIGGATAGTPVQLQIAQGGAPLPETVMIATPAAANDLNNVSKTTRVPGGENNGGITVINTGTTELTLGAGANLLIYCVA